MPSAIGLEEVPDVEVFLGGLLVGVDDELESVDGLLVTTEMTPPGLDLVATVMRPCFVDGLSAM